MAHSLRSKIGGCHEDCRNTGHPKDFIALSGCDVLEVWDFSISSPQQTPFQQLTESSGDCATFPPPAEAGPGATRVCKEGVSLGQVFKQGWSNQQPA